MFITQIDGKNINIPFNVDKGVYVVTIRPYIPKNTSEYQKYYFALVDDARIHTGWARYDLHEAYKEYSEVASTKILTEEEWLSFIDNFKLWIFNKFEIVI